MAECVWPGLRAIGLLMKGRVFKKKKERKDKERQTVEKIESINLVPSAFVYLVNSCGS